MSALDDGDSRLIASALAEHEARFHRKGLPAIVKAIDAVNKLATVFLKAEQVVFDAVPYNPDLGLQVGDQVIVEVQGGRSYFISSKSAPIGGAVPSPGYGARIAELLLTVDTLQLDFLNIPSIYKHLHLVILARGTAALTGSELDMFFNNDTGANYDYLYGILTSTGWTQVGVFTAGAMEMGTCVCANGPADAADCTVIDILGYSQTIYQKAALSYTQQKRGTTAGNVTRGVRSGWWRSTAAINRITVQLGAGNFKAGTIATLFGVG